MSSALEIEVMAILLLGRIRGGKVEDIKFFFRVLARCENEREEG